MAPCEKCVHEGICKFEKDVREYMNRLAQIEVPKTSATIYTEVKCASAKVKQQPYVPFRGGGRGIVYGDDDSTSRY